ncbi:DUF4910 domain-containing protein [Lacinutrix neustonica]|uniref:DUF4910 domain-containing protein n=1 Tax=Lacinutrix neustonica TaxID=2980107 RepID=A0A9E8MW54_9FLAO|nr:DUF4910 domain-containing protein [Lacinutrix neustonica]WAC02603.1 DUF4910 domain-containing protein [Lacinutrix neustonica]
MVNEIALLDRRQDTDGYNKAVSLIEKKAIEFGLENVNVESYKSDGETSYFGDTPQEIWSVKKGELVAKTPYYYKITSYDDLPMSLATNSYSTKSTATLIDIGEGTKNDYIDKDLKGKIVLTSKSPYSVIRKAVWEKGAIGIVSYYTIPYWDKTNRLEGDFVDQVGWSGMPKVDDDKKKSFAFMISNRKAKELKELLKKEEVKLHVDIETSFAKGDFGIVSGVITGSEFPDEEIIITSHIDHYKPGANDNASGSAVSLEVARTLNTLIEEKIIPRPLRTIRFLWLPEFTGTKAWFSRHLKDNKKRLVNLNLDMLGANLSKSNSFFSISYTPDWNASYLNAFSNSIIDFLNTYNNTKYPKRKDYNIISVNGSRNYVNAKAEPYTRGSDHQIFNDFGIPGIAYSTWPDNFYHSSQDTPDKVDPTQLHRVIFTSLSTIIMNAYAEDDNIINIVNLVEMYGKNRMKDNELEARKFLLSNNNTKAHNLYFSSQIVSYGYKREIKALQSILSLSKVENTEKIITEKKNQFIENEKQVIEELKILAIQNSKNKSFKTYQLSDIEKKSQKRIPYKDKTKQLNSFYTGYTTETNERYTNVNKGINKILSILRDREVGELRIYEFEDIILSYANGINSLLDIRNALFAEYKIEIPIELIKELFDVSEEAGIIKFK